MSCLAVPLAALLIVSSAWAGDKKQKATFEPSRGVNLYSLAEERRLGLRLAREVENEVPILYDPVVSEYVNRMGQNLVRQIGTQMAFTVKVIDSPDVNAFALPGGFLFVNTGMIRNAHSEAELAGVLAHEIAHVVARHATRQATRSQILEYTKVPLVFLGGWAGFLAGMAIDNAVPAGLFRFSRGMEREADRLGLHYLYQSGYDPVAFIDFFERMQVSEKEKKGAVARLFSSHPLTGDRIRRAQKEIQKDFTPRNRYVVDTSEFQEIRARLDRRARKPDAIVIIHLNDTSDRPR